MNTVQRARRITPEASRAITSVNEGGDNVTPAVPRMFVSVCATLVLGGLIMAGILAVGNVRPVPAYAVFGSAVFGLAFAAFLVTAMNLAISDGHRQPDDH